MPTEKSIKPQLSSSMISGMWKCGIQVQRRHGKTLGIGIEDEIIPPGIAMAIGTSTHEVVAKNLIHKMKNQELLPRADYIDLARDNWIMFYPDVMLTEEEAVNSKKTQGESTDKAIKLAAVHYDLVAPNLHPVAIEEKFVIEWPDYPYDLKGTKDLRENNSIVDLKTSAKIASGNLANSIQMRMYSLDEVVNDRGIPLNNHVDQLRYLKSGPKWARFTVAPTKTWIDQLLPHVERAITIIEAVKEGKQAMTPADPSDYNWVCSKKWCGYAETCEFWSGR